MICPQGEATSQKRSLSTESGLESGGVPLGPHLTLGSPGCRRGPGGDSPELSGTGAGDIFCLGAPYHFLGGKPPDPLSGGSRQGKQVPWRTSSAHVQEHLSPAILGSKSSEHQLREGSGPQDSGSVCLR